MHSAKLIMFSNDNLLEINKMIKIKLSLAISALIVSGTALANPMYINLPNNSYDTNRSIGAADPDTKTGNYTIFGFNDILATSIYDYSDNSIFGSFFDTNIPAELTGVGISSLPAGTTGTALDSVSSVTLYHPNTRDTDPLDPSYNPALGESDIDGLSPLVPPLGSNNEGFLQTWDLQVLYHFDGTLGAGGPTYTGGYLDIYFNDLINDANDRKVLTGTLTGSSIDLANLSLFFDVTFAEDNFLFINNGSSFVDANDGVVSGNYANFILDTNVDPPVPTANQLLKINDNVIRQTSLDGSITAKIPEPSILGLLGLGMLGLGRLSRKK